MDTRIIEKDSAGFPNLLREIADAPAQLYFKGVWDDRLFEHCLAVVGSRRMTQYGKRATEQLVGDAAAAGITIVSGFMYGIDATAHKAAVAAGGKTIAVMPCGIERIHPAHQSDLYEAIQETGGLIVSEWEGTMGPYLYTYPKRNRIVAGLAKSTLVVEAGLESGSLITAEFAKKFGRQVFAVPGPITSSISAGANQLIKEGARFVASAEDILRHYNGYKKDSSYNGYKGYTNYKGGGVEQRILETLRQESLEIDLLARTLRIPAAELGTTLSLMELQGVIAREGGKYYASS